MVWEVDLRLYWVLFIRVYVYFWIGNFGESKRVFLYRVVIWVYVILLVVVFWNGVGLEGVVLRICLGG